MPSSARTKYKAQVSIVIMQQNAYGDVENNSVLTYSHDLTNVGSLTQLGILLENIDYVLDNPRKDIANAADQQIIAGFGERKTTGTLRQWQRCQ